MNLINIKRNGKKKNGIRKILLVFVTTTIIVHLSMVLEDEEEKELMSKPKVNNKQINVNMEYYESPEYELMKNQFISQCVCDTQNLNNLKVKYAKSINSPRSIERIRNLSNLVYILEKRDLIRDDDVHVLFDIADDLNQENLKTYINQYTGQTAEPVEEIEEKVHSLIIEEIGHSWKDLARQLGLKEGQIDSLEDQHRSIYDRVRKVLIMHKNTCEPNKWKYLLLKALSSVRRNDLCYKIENMYDLVR